LMSVKNTSPQNIGH